MTVSLFYLGFAYERGSGVPQDYIYAHMWCNLSAARLKTTNDGERFWQEAAAYCRDRTAEKMTPNQIGEAQRLAREWMEKHQE